MTSLATAAKDFSANIDSLVLNIGEIEQYQEQFTKTANKILSVQEDFKAKSQELSNC